MPGRKDLFIIARPVKLGVQRKHSLYNHALCLPVMPLPQITPESFGATELEELMSEMYDVPRGFGGAEEGKSIPAA